MDRVEYEKHTVQDILTFYKSDELEINPWYQRRAVWSDSQKGYLINTLFEQKPVPTLYVRYTIDVERERSLREIVDGQQRIRSIIGYQAGEFPARHPEHKRSVRYDELTGVQKAKLLSTSLSIGYLIGASESDVIEIFGRINSVAKTLNAQEKRNANFSGDFKQYTVAMSAKLVPFWRSRNIFTATNISRMVEVEYVADLTMNLLNGIQDYTPSKLTKYYKDNEVTFQQWEQAEFLISSIFQKLNELDIEMIRDTIFRRPPILFSLCLVLKENMRIKANRLEEVISAIDRVGQASEKAGLSEEDYKFVNAISSSTQRIASRRARDRYIRAKIEAS